MMGVEIDMVVSDSIKALEWYEKIFTIQRIEVTKFPRGQNEAIFNLHGTRFHLLDENPEFHLIAPKKDTPKSLWINVTVPDIEDTYSKVMTAGCLSVQEVMEVPEHGVKLAIFTDPFGHLWMLHQEHRKVGFEDQDKKD